MLSLTYTNPHLLLLASVRTAAAISIGCVWGWGETLEPHEHPHFYSVPSASVAVITVSISMATIQVSSIVSAVYAVATVYACVPVLPSHLITVAMVAVAAASMVDSLKRTVPPLSSAVMVLLIMTSLIIACTEVMYTPKVISTNILPEGGM